MRTSLVCATLFSTALLGSGALAQTAATDNPAAPMKPAQTQTSKPDAQPAKSDAGISFVTAQAADQWRAPKLVGIGVFGTDEKQIGKIKDVLMGHDGKAETVVIGIGGFLGFGTKDVAVPFAAMQWRTEGRKMPATDQPPSNPVASTTGQAAGPPPMKETDPAATEASQGYPDKAILGVTLAELKAAPDFRYAPNPLDQSEARSTTDSGAAKKTTP
ncbi:MAG: PRC-barrel domain-containing protein [Hyphomicrobiales bacterium]|nr:PRC-barrel domain-containing protein [Hyphomicrobiales bacterium]